MSSDKTILVFPTPVLKEIGYFQGMNFNYRPYVERILGKDVSYLEPNRSDLEDDPTRKQIIPYIIIEAKGKILYYLRSKNHGEGRLASKGSIGIGGHVSDIDVLACHQKNLSIREIYKAGAAREADEELIIDTPFEDNVVAVLNDDSDHVGQVHFGIVHLRRLKEPRVQKKDDEIAELTFLSLDELESQRNILENWSKICLDNIGTILSYR